MKTWTVGKVLAGLAFASMIGGLSSGTALGDDRGWRQAPQSRGYEGNRRDNRGWHDKRGWRDTSGWRDARGGWHTYQPVYAPPPVIYVPAPSHGINIFFPFFR